MDHLLPSTDNDGAQEESDALKHEEELRVACFMGLLSYLADRPEVLRVSPLHMPATLNAVARAIIQSANTEDTPLSDAGLDGTGEVVQVYTYIRVSSLTVLFNYFIIFLLIHLVGCERRSERRVVRLM